MCHLLGKENLRNLVGNSKRCVTFNFSVGISCVNSFLRAIDGVKTFSFHWKKTAKYNLTRFCIFI